MRQLTPPDPLPDFVGKCKGCGASYHVASDEFKVESFKVSGYFFDGSDVCEDLAYVVCPHCKKDLFQKDMDPVPAEGPE